VSGLAELMFFC